MSAGFHHFIIEQGATFKKILTLKDSSGSELKKQIEILPISTKKTNAGTNLLILLS